MSKGSAGKAAGGRHAAPDHVKKLFNGASKSRRLTGRAKLKAEERERLQGDVEAYLAAGGSITELPGPPEPTPSRRAGMPRQQYF